MRVREGLLLRCRGTVAWARFSQAAIGSGRADPRWGSRVRSTSSTRALIPWASRPSRGRSTRVPAATRLGCSRSETERRVTESVVTELPLIEFRFDQGLDALELLAFHQDALAVLHAGDHKERI